MLEIFSTPSAWVSLATLTGLEIVLGIDNIVFITVLAGKLPKEQRRTATRLGLAAALITRLLLLFTLSWVMRLSAPLVTLAGHEVTGRDLVLILGGLFLMAKATLEIYDKVEAHDPLGSTESSAGSGRMVSVVAQIMVLDMVFSLDSVITAIGIAEHIPIMIAAITIAMAVMLLAAEPTARFVNAHPTVKMLALSFLLLVGAALVADGAHFHIPRGYLYFAIAFSIGVESLNLLAAAARRRRRARRGA